MDFKTTIMNKKYFFKLLFILTINLSFSQGNLQFNRVISEIVTATNSNGAELNGTLLGNIVVPAGKVLKLESVSVYLNDNTGDIETYWVQDGTAQMADTGCWIGNHLVWAPYAVRGGTHWGKFMETSTFPIWFGAGTYEIRTRFATVWGAGSFSVVTYSAIEFNIN